MKTYSTAPRPGEILTPVACPVCGETQAHPYWDLGSFRMARCHCGHIYQNPRPSNPDLIDRYDDQYRNYEIENASNFLNLMLLGLQDVGFYDLEAKIPTGERSFLDVGCATGALVEWFAHRNWKARGLEVCEEAALWGREHRGVEIIIGTLEDSGIPNESVDLIHSSHVIEHVPEPFDFLTEFHRVLKPGGHAIIVTPNTASLQRKVFGGQWRSTIADHVHLFNKSNLFKLLTKAGLRPVRHKTWGGLAIGAGPRWLKKLADPLAKAWGFGDVVAVLAQKI